MFKLRSPFHPHIEITKHLNLGARSTAARLFQLRSSRAASENQHEALEGTLLALRLDCVEAREAIGCLTAFVVDANGLRARMNRAIGQFERLQAKATRHVPVMSLSEVLSSFEQDIE